MNGKLVSVIIPNWNGEKTLPRCLAAVKSQTYPHIEVIVVDNNSQDHSIEIINEKYPAAKIIKNNENKGYPAANNQGFKAAQGRYFMMLNNDTEMFPDCIEQCVAAIEKDPQYGSCATKMLLDTERTVVDAAGIAIFKDGLSIGRGRKESADRYNSPAEVFFPSDGACLYRRELIEGIGEYDEDFFCYAEEAEMGFRAQLRGWKSIYEPRAVVYHCHSASTGGGYSPFKAFHVERNRAWVVLKTFPMRYLLAVPYHNIIRYWYQAWGAFTGKGAAGKFGQQFSKMSLLWILAKVYLSLLVSLPGVLKKRRTVMVNAKIDTKEFGKLFKKFGISAKEIALKE